MFVIYWNVAGVRYQAVSPMQTNPIRSRPEIIQGRQSRGQSEANKTEKGQAEEDSRGKADRSRWRSGRKGIRR